LDSLLDKIQRPFHELRLKLQRLAFGQNNEKLDFIMDSFYKLNTSQRNSLLAASGAAIAVFLMVALAFYFTGISALERELNDGFKSLHRLKELKAEYSKEERRYDRLVELLGRTREFRFLPFFEQTARNMSTPIERLNERREPMPPDSMLSQRFQYVYVDMRLPNVSLPRMINFLSEVERTGTYLTVDTLRVAARPGTLFFDVDVTVRGYARGD